MSSLLALPLEKGGPSVEVVPLGHSSQGPQSLPRKGHSWIR